MVLVADEPSESLECRFKAGIVEITADVCRAMALARWDFAKAAA